MRIGVISDTHGDTSSINRAISVAGDIDHWLHAGDYCQDGYYLAKITGLPVTAVAGNCDRNMTGKVDEFIHVGGVDIWLTHGNRFQVKWDLEELAYWGRQYEAGIVVFGHTHVPYNSRHDGILLFNPGSPSVPRGGYPPSFGIITIHPDKRIEADIISLYLY
ncbi:MAG TPA: metallophosphoesterase [Methylomusa anaerophila]|uniref:Phosphoesterase n=1 Tax=Methylomusa anaerophila TaxID=1930071 RepID=A0A348AFZ6_9FIRM|nr:metallophosphoesterase [Methylomusa anaerophila]BBB89994.1 phosphodiesterase YfcE [Methylomusa anaerophila]HML88277.1 metallophosphoesterase [Methylomusa anaerophila]